MALIFSLAIVLNATLLFLIQPLVAKMILPWLGGSPAVWNTSLVFYQACLLAGYAYAHILTSWLGTKVHALLHLGLLGAALLLLPIVLPIDSFRVPSGTPVSLMLWVLTVTIGFPFFVLSAGAPLIQKWFAHCQDDAARDPYFLYSVSNAGSIAGLLAYPLLLEPRLTLSQQNYLWFCGFLTLLGVVSVCVLYFLRPLGRAQVQPIAALNTNLGALREVTLAQRTRWIVWSFVPSSLLLGVTSYVTTDIVSMPLLWVLPLVAYLLSFVIAFARVSWATSSFLVRLQAVFLLGAAITVFMHATEPSWIILPLHLIAFVLTAIVCHGQLAKDRPDPARLTDFYFWISLGGVLGGAFNALVAPQVFRFVLEYPIAIAAAAFLRPYIGKDAEKTKWQRCLDWTLPPALIIALMMLTLAMKQSQWLPSANERFLLLAASGVICLLFAYRPLRFGIGLTAMTMVSLWYPSPWGETLYMDRSFFGAYRATLDAKAKKHVLFQGTTVHGAQSIVPQSRHKPLTYYHRTGPAGRVLLAAQSKEHAAGNIAIIGLGIGALACHGIPSQKFTFYEIDPLVEKIARNEKLFTYLRDCPPRTEVVIGDARISLARAPEHGYDIFVLDAFSSDVIPTHLLTREAVQLYLNKTAADGILLFHISNRYLDLTPVLDRVANNLKLVAFVQNDFSMSAQEQQEGKSPSRWVVLSRDEEAIAHYVKDSRWQHLNGQLGGDLWTDEFSDTFKLISWR